MDRTEEVYELLRQFIIKTEVRLEKLEVIHTRYTRSAGPAGPKGEKGDSGKPADLSELHKLVSAFREELYVFKNDLHSQAVNHSNDLSETYKRYQEETAAPQSSLDLCCFGASSLGITGVADPSGNYDFFVPIGASGTDYTTLSLSVTDPESGTTLTSETVNLTGLNQTTPVNVSPVTATCTDTDTATPDGDDPDCD